MAYPIDNNFMYHAPKEGQKEVYESIRAKAKELARFVLDTCPESRDWFFFIGVRLWWRAWTPD